MNKTSKKIIGTALSIAVAASLAGPFVIPVNAATRTVSTKATKIQKAPAVKKGRSVVKIKKNFSFIRFKAPKTKTYRFTFSNLNALRKADRRRNSANGSVYLGFAKYGIAIAKPVKTNYGTASYLEFASKNFCKSFYRHIARKKKPTEYFTSRYAKIKLYKGQTVYVYHFFAGVKNSNVSYNLTIK